MEFTKYYSAIEFKKIADVCLIQHPMEHFDISMLKDKSKIIILTIHHNVYFEFILNSIIPYISVPFVLISSFDDYTFPDDFNNEHIYAIKNSRFFHHWFSINKSIPDDKYFSSIFYGMDYVKWRSKHSSLFCSKTSIEQDNIFQKIINNSKNLSERIPKIHCSFHLNLTDGRHGSIRDKLKSILPEDITYFQETLLERTKYWEQLSNYAFCLSPPGNGLDCIRTFESLCLGCIVIMKSSVLDSLYEDLPVLIVKEYSDINEDLLNDTLASYSTKKFNYEKLTMKYWVDMVNSKI
jgi:hypothetical protein